MSVVQRPRAKADLAEIWKYIADDSERRADAFIDTIDGNRVWDDDVRNCKTVYGVFRSVGILSSISSSPTGSRW